MPSEPCKALNKQGYLFFSPTSTAALKPCLWCKRALAGGDMCYKHQFYGIDSHRCVQMTPTLKCNQRCLFCWRSFEHEMAEVEECPPETILAGVHKLQKKALAGYNSVLGNTVTEEKWKEALAPKHVAISLSGEPTLHSRLPETVDLFNANGYTTFIVSNGTNPDVLAKCRPFQQCTSRSMHPTRRPTKRPVGPWATRTGMEPDTREPCPTLDKIGRPCGLRWSPGTTTRSRRLRRSCRTQEQPLSR